MAPQKIIIFWLRWSGKTTLAKMVGEYFGLTHTDLDMLITEKSGESISQIVEKYGWEEFRIREHDTLSSFLETWKSGVLSLGGGCPAFENNRSLLSASWAKLIYIDVTADRQLKHISEDEKNHADRPSFSSHIDTIEDYQRIRDERIGEYLKLADGVIENNSTLQDTFEKIINEIQKGDICVSLLSEQSETEQEEIFSHPQIKCVEWRADSLTVCPHGFEKTQKKKIITLRTQAEWWLWSGSDEEYFSELEKYSALSPDFLDIEYMRWKNHPEKMKKIKIPILLSYHNQTELPNNEVLKEILLDMMNYEPNIVKIACRILNPEDKNHLSRIRTWFREKFPKQETIFIGMGELWSDLRGILAHEGDIYTFASVGASSAPGQMNVSKTHHMIYSHVPYTLACESWENDTRNNLKTSTTKLEKKSYKSVFLGAAQIQGSLSPEIHNSWAQSEHLDLEYILCDLEKGVWGGMPMEDVLEKFEKIPEVIWGNITMPYKIDAYEYFKQKNRLDEVGFLAGSVNTYFRGVNNEFYATSSDVNGFVEPVKTIEPGIQDFHVVILWAGWAARAILAWAYISWVKKITIINRSKENFDELQKIFDGKITSHFIPLDDEEIITKVLSQEKYILVNTLPFGFKKELPIFPLKKEILEKIHNQCHIYFDIVYDRNEGMTPTSSWFQENSPVTHLIHGKDMLLAQAKKWYELWREYIISNSDDREKKIFKGHTVWAGWNQSSEEWSP
jgi:shikimate dehydrogenase